MMLLSYTIVDFYLFYNGVVDMKIWALLTRSQCKVSDTQVTVKACGLLVCLPKGSQKMYEPPYSMLIVHRWINKSSLQ